MKIYDSVDDFAFIILSIKMCDIRCIILQQEITIIHRTFHDIEKGINNKFYVLKKIVMYITKHDTYAVLLHIN